MTSCRQTVKSSPFTKRLSLLSSLLFPDSERFFFFTLPMVLCQNDERTEISPDLLTAFSASLTFAGASFPLHGWTPPPEPLFLPCSTDAAAWHRLRISSSPRERTSPPCSSDAPHSGNCRLMTCAGERISPVSARDVRPSRLSRPLSPAQEPISVPHSATALPLRTCTPSTRAGERILPPCLQGVPVCGQSLS